jgi:hypothetical protein
MCNVLRFKAALLLMHLARDQLKEFTPAQQLLVG